MSKTPERTYIHTVLSWRSLLRYNSLTSATYIAYMILFESRPWHIGARIYRYLGIKRLGGEQDTRTYIGTYSTFLKVVVTVQLSHKCYLYSIYDTFWVALTYRSKNIEISWNKTSGVVSTTPERTYVHTVLSWRSLLRYNSLTSATYIAYMILFA